MKGNGKEGLQGGRNTRRAGAAVHGPEGVHAPRFFLQGPDALALTFLVKTGRRSPRDDRHAACASQTPPGTHMSHTVTATARKTRRSDISGRG